MLSVSYDRLVGPWDQQYQPLAGVGLVTALNFSLALLEKTCGP